MLFTAAGCLCSTGLLNLRQKRPAGEERREERGREEQRKESRKESKREREGEMVRGNESTHTLMCACAHERSSSLRAVLTFSCLSLLQLREGFGLHLLEGRGHGEGEEGLQAEVQ